MPVKWLLHWQPNVGSLVTTQILTELCQCIEGVNRQKGRRWKAIVSQYRPIVKDESQRAEYVRDFLGISFQELPNKHYFVVRNQRLVMESDENLPSILEKLQSYKKGLTLVFEGYQYQLGDFQLKVGKASVTEVLKGIVMEVEYLPVSSLEKTRALMEEFFDCWQETLSGKSLSGHFIQIEANFAEYRLSDQYSWQHTAVLYGNALVQVMSVRS